MIGCAVVDFTPETDVPHLNPLFRVFASVFKISSPHPSSALSPDHRLSLCLVSSCASGKTSNCQSHSFIAAPSDQLPFFSSLIAIPQHCAGTFHHLSIRLPNITTAPKTNTTLKTLKHHPASSLILIF